MAHKIDPRVNLPELCNRLAALTGQPISYAWLYKRVVSGAISVERDRSKLRGWEARVADIPKIARELGLKVPTKRKAVAA